MIMAPPSFTFVLVVLIVELTLLTGGAAAFVLGFNKSIIGNKRTNQNTNVIRSEETALLFSFQPQQRPPPRRALKKVWMIHFLHDMMLSLSFDITNTHQYASTTQSIKLIHVRQRKNKRRERMESAIKNTNTLNTNSNNKSNNNNDNIFGSGDNDYDADEIEIRPIRRKDAVQAGMDYWIDDSDFEREKQRRIAIKNRKVSMYIYVF